MGPFAGRWELHIDALGVCPRAHFARLAGGLRFDDGDLVASLAAGCSARAPEVPAERRDRARETRGRLPGASAQGLHAACRPHYVHVRERVCRGLQPFCVCSGHVGCTYSAFLGLSRP